MTTIDIREHPRLFTTQMVRAILDGRKTNSRDLVTPRTSLFDGGPVYNRIKDAWHDFEWDKAWIDSGPSPAGNSGPYLHVPAPKELFGGTTHRIYPRVQVGDLFYVRETWREADKLVDGYERDACYFVQFKANGFVYEIKPDGTLGREYDDGNPKVQGTWSTDNRFGKWKPNIHMPKKYAREWLEVTEVRVHKIKEIKPEDVKREGFMTSNYDGLTNKAQIGFLRLHDFIAGWNSLYPGSWQRNGWTWAYTFKRRK